MKHKTTGVLKTMDSKKQVNKSVKNKKKVVKASILGVINDEDIDTKDIDMSKGQSSHYNRDTNADDVDNFINDEFHHDTPHVSPRKVASVKSNIEEIRNSDVTVNTSNMDKNIINDEKTSTSLPSSTITVKQPYHTSHVDLNVNMGEKSIVETSIVPPTSNSLLRISLIPSTSIPPNYPAYDGILSQPIATLFSSQSTDHSLD